jgi:branched-chain amino acid transport system ATP-binding protein
MTDAGARRETVLALDDVSVSFGGVRALHGVSLSVAAGEICGLIGPNGAGKTTLFDVVAGERRPDTGRVVIDGREVTSLGPAERSRRGVRRTFQRVQMFGWLTVEENILTALEWHGGGGGVLADLVYSPTRRRRERQRRQSVAEVIERCSLGAIRSECGGSLPIGVARMVEFARAIAEPPRLLLLDEPASGLSEHEIERLGELMQAVRDETGCAVLLVEHNAGFVMQHCDRVVVLALGAKLAQGTPDEVRRNPAVQAAYLGQGAA